MPWLLVLSGCLLGAALSGANGSLLLGLTIGGLLGRLIALFVQLGRKEGAKLLIAARRRKKSRAASVRFREDQFTNRAAQALQFAREEAAKLQHDYLATEHLLLALARARSGVLEIVMRELFLPDYDALAKDVEQLAGRGTGRIDPARELLHTPRLRRVLERAVAVADEFANDRVDSEHLFYALLQENDGVATRILRDRTLDFDDARRLTLEHLGHQFDYGSMV
jgi:Clp amino terminal domain, pathogenicity island component